MVEIIIKPADNDKYGASKENIFYAYKNGEICGGIYLYPFEGSPDIEFPRNIYIDIYSEGKNMDEEVKDALLVQGKKRAEEIKREKWAGTTKLYACFLQEDKDGIDYFKSRDFVHDSGMYIMNRNLLKGVPEINTCNSLKTEQWNMETKEEQLKFIETHKKHHKTSAHYSCEKIKELKNLPLWTNFTIFNEENIIGNVMVFKEVLEDGTGCRGWIEDLFVEKEWRRKGLAKELMIHALNYFKENKVNDVALEVWRDNKNGMALYESLGFEIIEETQVALGIYI